MESANHLLIIGAVWPEPNSSAAGSRMLQLIDLFLELNFRITFASPTLKTEHAFNLSEKNIPCIEIKVNSSEFDVWIKKEMPSHVMFDRFMMEEQFGWRVAEKCPQAIRILDTEDLHCLRKTRQACFKASKEFTLTQLNSSELTKRELASIVRSDLSIMISDVEMEILKTHFQIPEYKLMYIPFLVEVNNRTLKTFHQRKNFMTIGSFRHEPNVDSILYLKNEIWPAIRKKLPHAELHIYGSYPKQSITQLHNPSQGFIIKGWVNDVNEVVESAKVMLAPLRFGAGQKGKFIDALINGTPSVTTSIGAEGMVNKENWSGCITDDPDEIIKEAIRLYEEEEHWNSKHAQANKLLESHFNKSKFTQEFKSRIRNISREVLPFYMESLIYHSFRNSRFMSKWIEEKNTN